MSSYLPVGGVATNLLEEIPGTATAGQQPIRTVKVIRLVKCLDCFALLEEKDADFHTNYHLEAQ